MRHGIVTIITLVIYGGFDKRINTYSILNLRHSNKLDQIMKFDLKITHKSSIQESNEKSLNI